MARKYNVNTTFTLSTEYEPEIDLRHVFNNGEDFEDNTYFHTQSLDLDGEFSFVLEAENENDAYDLANENVSEGAEIDDDLGITWQFSSVDHEIELIEEPMTLQRAREILTNVANAYEGEYSDELGEAVAFVFDTISGLEMKVHSASRRVDALLAEIREAREALATATAVATPTDGEEPTLGTYTGQ